MLTVVIYFLAFELLIENFLLKFSFMRYLKKPKLWKVLQS